MIHKITTGENEKSLNKSSSHTGIVSLQVQHQSRQTHIQTYESNYALPTLIASISLMLTRFLITE